MIAGWTQCPSISDDINGTWDLPAIGGPCTFFLTIGTVPRQINLSLGISGNGDGTARVALTVIPAAGGALMFNAFDDATAPRTCAITLTNLVTTCGTNWGKNGTATVTFI